MTQPDELTDEQMTDGLRTALALCRSTPEAGDALIDATGIGPGLLSASLEVLIHTLVGVVSHHTSETPDQILDWLSDRIEAGDLT